MSIPSTEKIGIVGLGYVGLPLAVTFASKFDVVGFDLSSDRITELKSGHDHTNEVEADQLENERLVFTDKPDDLASCTFIIVAVPTPITSSREPDLGAVIGASRTVASILKKGMCVVYESTVYPGVTEETCLPILEEASGLKLGDFGLGYSPERVNPGDKEHTIDKIVKVVSGHDADTLERVAGVYGSIITAGVHRAPNIKTAEAAKVIENVQRDLNIALMNELSKIFNRLGIQSKDVLEAASTKWNFHRYSPGLVGGHCIGVDPYYLTHRAVEMGYEPQVILAGRRINDFMGNYVAKLAQRELIAADRLPRTAKIWVLGLTFKENVPDFRNTRATDVVAALKNCGAEVTVWEPLVKEQQIREKFGLDTTCYEDVSDIDAVVLINGHDAFSQITLSDLKKKMRTPVLIDVKNFFDRDEALALGFRYVSL